MLGVTAAPGAGDAEPAGEGVAGTAAGTELGDWTGAGGGTGVEATAGDGVAGGLDVEADEDGAALG